MSTPLLTTKFYIPPVRPGLVSRPRLIQRLNAGLHRKLTLISAPAGFGKTTLLSEWVASCGRPVAWLSLDEGDNDPARFWAYFVAALQTIPSLSEVGVGESALAVLQPPQPLPIEAVLTALINEIVAVPDSFVLVLDDYHAIKAQPIHDALTFLLDHLPGNMHLVIATRADPPLPLPRLRVRGELTELRAVDLRFTSDEVAAFFNEVMGLGLSTENVAALEARTEGWVAGLQVAALSLQGQQDTASFIQAFTGSHRYVLDYLAEEVLQQQPDSVQTFLLETSILDRLTGPLCDAVLRISESANQRTVDTLTRPLADSQAMLEYLESSNLFIVPLDNERRWYRYHHLFADLLCARLQQTQPDRVPELHRRAARWYEQNGLITEAVGHALTGGDFERAARFVEQIAPTTLWAHGEVVTLLGWLEMLPDELVHSRPRLCLAHAWGLIITPQLEAAEARLQDAEQALHAASLPGDDADIQGMLGEIAVMRAMIANFRGDVSHTIELSRQALEQVSEDNLFLRSSIAMNLAAAYWISGDVVAASQLFAEGSRLAWAAGNTFTALFGSSYLAEMQVIQGQLHEAAKTYQQTLQLAAEESGQQSLGTAMALVGLGGLLREWNDLDTATHHLRKGIELGEKQGDVVTGPSLQILMGGYLALARVYQARGNVDGALEMIRRAERLARKHDPSQVAQVAAAQLRLWVAQGDLTAAARWAQECGLSAGDEPNYAREFEHLTLARVLIAQGKPDEAAESLKRLLQPAEAAGRMGSVIETLTLQALALQTQGKTDWAMSALERALSLAEPEDYVRTFVDEGAPMEKLLRRALSQDIAPDYVSRLLASFGEAAEPVSPMAQPLIEPLSQRELEVLRLIADGLSNREIAEELSIAITTVKKHVSNIYGKLGVRSRTQAVAQARTLRLL